MKNNEEETKTAQKIVEIKSVDERLKDLIKIGKEKKYVTFEQIVESLKGLDVDNDSLDKIYNELMENDIQVIAEGEEEETDSDGVPKNLEEPVLLDDSELILTIQFVCI